MVGGFQEWASSLGLNKALAQVPGGAGPGLVPQAGGRGTDIGVGHRPHVRRTCVCPNSASPFSATCFGRGQGGVPDPRRLGEASTPAQSPSCPACVVSGTSAGTSAHGAGARWGDGPLRQQRCELERDPQQGGPGLLPHVPPSHTEHVTRATGHTSVTRAWGWPVSRARAWLWWVSLWVGLPPPPSLQSAPRGAQSVCV